MFEEKFLTTRDKNEWLSLLKNPDCQDPHYLPNYLKIYEEMDEGEPQRQFGGEGFLFVYGDRNNYIIYPFIKRPIFESERIGPHLLFDVSPPYGYGGPLASIQNSELSDELWANFFYSWHQYCNKNNIVSEFARLHPIFRNHENIMNYSDGVILKRGKLVYLDLELPEETILKNMSSSRRQNIKAATSNIKYEYNSSLEMKYADIFYELYVVTMKRNEAEAKYLFSRRFFEKVFNNLDSCCTFDYVKYENTICSGCLCLFYGQNAYLFLQASNTTSSSAYANVFLVYKTLTMLKNRGFKTFVLGGGVSSMEDSLFQYKYRFSQLTLDSYVYNKIHINEAYEKLVNFRKTRGEELSSDYFPQYRSPKIQKYSNSTR
jgi:hypothetical protein